MVFGKTRKTTSIDERFRVAISDSAPCRKALTVRVHPEAIAPVRLRVVDEFQKATTLRGFRKGKAPAELVSQQYAQSIQDETLHRVTTQVFEQAARDHGFRPVSPFEVRRADFSESQGLTLEAQVEVEPAFALGDYQRMSLTRPSVVVRPEDVDGALERLRGSMGQLVPTGQEGKKTAELPALDDELAKDLGFESLSALRTHVEAKLRQDAEQQQARALEQALCDALLTRHQFDVPAGLVGRQTERLSREFRARLVLSGVREDRVEEELGKFTEQLKTTAAQRVKLGFILDRIAEREEVEVGQEDLVARLWQLAQRWHKDPAETRKILDAQGLWPAIVSTIRQEKTIARLLKRAVTDGADAPREPSAA
ncbi:MAG TPA: trigger factor [bacterium]